MKKVRLSIVKTGNEYRAVIQIGENPYLTDREVVYHSSREIKNSLINVGASLAEVRARSEELREEAKKWAREHKIPYVVNIDLNL